jgi:hypothetical protein
MPTYLSAAASIFFLVPSIAGAAEEIYFQQRNQLICSEERDIVEIVDTHPSKRQQKVLADLSEKTAYSCVPVPGMQHLTNVTEKQTPRGNAYICFDIAASEQSLQYGPLCSLPHAVTTLRASLLERKGSYKITDKSEFFVAAECSEGGRVVLQKKDGKAWERASYGVFPIKPKKPGVETIQPQQVAIREGCKGADYK